jgi:hypothetical protein
MIVTVLTSLCGSRMSCAYIFYFFSAEVLKLRCQPIWFEENVRIFSRKIRQFINILNTWSAGFETVCHGDFWSAAVNFNMKASKVKNFRESFFYQS